MRNVDTTDQRRASRRRSSRSSASRRSRSPARPVALRGTAGSAPPARRSPRPTPGCLASTTRAVPSARAHQRARPVGRVVGVHQQADGGVRGDVRQPPQPARPLRLVVDGGDDPVSERPRSRRARGGGRRRRRRSPGVPRVSPRIGRGPRRSCIGQGYGPGRGANRADSRIRCDPSMTSHVTPLPAVRPAQPASAKRRDRARYHQRAHRRRGDPFRRQPPGAGAQDHRVPRPRRAAGRHVGARAPHPGRRRAVRAPGRRDAPRAGRHRADAQRAGRAACGRLRSGRRRHRHRARRRRRGAWPRRSSSSAPRSRRSPGSATAMRRRASVR